MEYILMLLIIFSLPMVITLVGLIVYKKIIARDTYDHSWAETGAFLVGLRYTLKWMTKFFFKGR